MPSGGNVYTVELLKGYEVKDLTFTDKTGGIQERNRVAKKLRTEGWTVKSETWHFDRGNSYTIEARRKKQVVMECHVES
jgi:hypothetical protein